MKRNRVIAVIATTVASAGIALAGVTSASAAVPPANPSGENCANATADAVILDNFTIVETAGRHDAPDGRLSHDDLVAAGEFFNGQPLNVQNATNHILGTPGLEANLDSAAHGGPPDNNISRNDLRHHLAREIFVVFNVEEILAEIDNQLDQNAENFVRGHCG